MSDIDKCIIMLAGEVVATGIIHKTTKTQSTVVASDRRLDGNYSLSTGTKIGGNHKVIPVEEWRYAEAVAMLKAKAETDAAEREAKRAKWVLIYDSGDEPVAVGTVHKETATQLNVNRHGNFLKSTGKEVGGTHRIKVVDESTYTATKDALEANRVREREERYAKEELERQAAYDALPEAVRLAKSLAWIFQCNNKEKFATAPVDALRAIVTWAKENGLETE